MRLCPVQSGSATVRLPIEKSLVAGRLGMQPETFSRSLSKLKQVGVKCQGHEVMVADIAKLSTQVRNIIAIDTGPTGSTFNIWNQWQVKHRFILHRENYFTHEGCHAVKRWEDLYPALLQSGALRHTTS